MNKRYYSKISYGLLGTMLILFLSMWLIPIMEGASIDVIIIMGTVTLGSSAFILHAFYTTYYWINDQNELRIKAGFMNNMTIPIEKIHKIKKTNSLLASPAASFDRIEVFYGKWDSVIISPKDKAGLTSALQSINSKINVSI